MDNSLPEGSQNSVENPISNQNTIFQPPKQQYKKILVVVVVLTLLMLGAIVYLSISNKQGGGEEVATKPVISKPPVFQTVTSPTPFPFRELTIPYLREREYTSKLGDREVAYENESYTAYITSYDSDGLKLRGLLTIPHGDAKAKFPAIVFVHGYIPPTQYQTNGQAYSAYVDYLARSGFVVFKIDLRGHGESEGKPGGAYYSSDYIIDTLHAYAALQSADFVDPEKIGLWGHSMAGNVSMRSFATKTDIPAVVIWAGAGYSYEDLLAYRIMDASYQPSAVDPERQRRRRELFEKYGSPSAKAVFWQQVAPVTYLNELKGALQLHHAVDDDVVNVEYSRNLDKLLDTTAVVHEFFEYSSGGHNIAGASFNQAMERTVAFYKKYLQILR